MTKTPPKQRKSRPEKVNVHSWADEGPLQVKIEGAPSSAQMFWLRFWRRDFTSLVFTSIADAELLHAQLGGAIAAAKAEMADCARQWATELAAEAAALAPAPVDPDASTT